MLTYSNIPRTALDYISNGCGGKGSLIPIPNFLFKASCNQHDFYYWRGGTEDDRTAADKAFYKYMKIDVEDKGLALVPYLTAHVWAYAYYSAVKYFGNSYFYYADSMRTEVDLKALIKDV